MSRTRNFSVTCNNPSEEDEARIMALDYKYVCYGREVGEQGTPHLQGMIVFKSGKTLSAVIKLLPGWHCEPARDVYALEKYCKKDGVVTEDGVAPVNKQEQGQMNTDRYAAALIASRAGKFDEIPADLYTRHSRFYKAEFLACKKDAVPKWVKMDSEWYWGASGTGKTRSARETYPDAYIKMRNKWWDDYEFQEVVIIDDIDPTHELKFGAFLKDYGDHYAFRCEIKGTSTLIRPKKVIVTSQYSIDQIFKDPETVAALKRRYKVKHFGLNVFNPSSFFNP